jgi:hypothetical protein
MVAVMRRIALVVSLVVLGLVSGCTSLDPAKQWYKPGGNYTVAEWQKDQSTCTTKSGLDEDCLKDKGWVPLSGDPSKPPPPPRNPKGDKIY